MDTRIKRFRDIYILLLEGELDLYHTPAVEEQFYKLCRMGIHRLILDLEEVSYIDSSGVGILLKLKNLSMEKKVNFSLSGVAGEVLNVLKLTNLVPFFSIADTYQQGIVRFLTGEENHVPTDA